MGIGLVLTSLLSLWTERSQRTASRLVFEREAQTQIHSIQMQIEDDLGRARILGDLFRSHLDVTRDQFRGFTAGTLRRRAGIRALEWAPRVSGDERAALEQQVRRSGFADFQITDQTAEGQVAPATQRSEYFPILYTEPLTLNRQAFGLDLMTRPVAKDALTAARDTGEMRITPPLRLIQDPETADGILAFVPLYEPGANPKTTEQRRRVLRGFAVTAYHVSDMVEAALKPFAGRPMSLVHRLYIQTGPDDYRLVTVSNKQSALGDLHYSEPIVIGHRSWLISSQPTREAMIGLGTPLPWLVLAAGLMVTSLVTGYLWQIIGRAVQIESIVGQRTSELAQANGELRRENEKRLAAERDLSTVLAKERQAHQTIREAQEELAASEARYRIMGETIPYGVWLTDPDGEPQYFSQSFLDLLDMSLEETRHYGWTKRLAPEEIEPAIARLEESLRTGDLYESEHRVRGPDNVYRVILVRGLPVRDASGRITSWVGINLDITDRKQAEEELRQHRDYLEELVRSRTLELMIANEELRHDIEQREKVETSLRSLQESLEEQVQTRTAELAATNRELEAFSYSVSHDLRAPVRHITGFVQLLQKQAGDQLNESSRRQLRVIGQAAIRMGQLIDDLLQFSRLGRAAMRLKAVDVASLIEDVRQELSTESNGRDVEWIIHPMPMVQADASLLRIVLVNLLSNALKYTRKREKARIEVGAADEMGEQTSLFIRDNGVGFDMQYVDRLFGVFQRLHKAEEFEGTGIGLAIVQRIVHRHGGTIRAEGTIEGGATFWFTLPRVEGADVRLEAHIAGRG